MGRYGCCRLVTGCTYVRTSPVSASNQCEMSVPAAATMGCVSGPAFACAAGPGAPPHARASRVQSTGGRRRAPAAAPSRPARAPEATPSRRPVCCAPPPAARPGDSGTRGEGTGPPAPRGDPPDAAARRRSRLVRGEEALVALRVHQHHRGERLLRGPYGRSTHARARDDACLTGRARLPARFLRGCRSLLFAGGGEAELVWRGGSPLNDTDGVRHRIASFPLSGASHGPAYFAPSQT